METSISTSRMRGRITSASLGCPAADSGRGIVLKAVFAECTLMIDESMLKSLDLLVESPEVRECRRRSSVQALTLESTSEENESETFLDSAVDA